MLGTASICCSWSLLFLTLWLSSGRKWTVWSLTSLIISGDRLSQALWHREVMASLCLHNTGFSRAPVLAGASTITQMQNNQINITDKNLLPTFWADSCLPVSIHPQSPEQEFGFHLHHINKHPKASLNNPHNKCFHVLKQENYYYNDRVSSCIDCKTALIGRWREQSNRELHMEIKCRHSIYLSHRTDYMFTARISFGSGTLFAKLVSVWVCVIFSEQKLDSNIKHIDTLQTSKQIISFL